MRSRELKQPANRRRISGRRFSPSNLFFNMNPLGAYSINQCHSPGK